MFSKTPRQTIFDTVSSTPGPGAYNPKDTKGTMAQGNINFNRQSERFRREDSNLSTCSTSTTGSASSFRRPVASSRATRLQDRLRTFEQQIREREQIIARLRMDRSATLTRYQTLFDAYKHLRRVSAQSIPAHKLPKDISQEIMRALQEEKTQTKDESRPSMSEGEIKETMTTFIVEMEQDEDPRIALLESEKAAIEVTLVDVSTKLRCQKRLKELEQEREKLNQDMQESALEIGRLKGCLRAAEVKDVELRSQLDRANAVVDSLSSSSTNKDERLFATLTELCETKGQVVALESSLAQQASRHDEARAKYEDNVTQLKAQIEAKDRSLKELTESLTEKLAERERLTRELMNTSTELNKLVQENNALEQKTNVADAELEDLRAKCRKRKVDIAALDEELRSMKGNYDQTKTRLLVAEQEVEKLREELKVQLRSGGEFRSDAERQLRQSQANFERQLDEAAKKYDSLAAQKAEVEAELRIAASNMRIFERQVQERDELLEKGQRERLGLEEQICGRIGELESLNKQLSEKSEKITTLEDKVCQLQAAEEAVSAQIIETEEKCQDIIELAENRLNEIRQLEGEVRALKAANAYLEASLKGALDQLARADERQRTTEQESSQIKLLHLATTAELEHLKGALDKAREDTSEIDALREELSSAERVKAALSTRVAELEGDTATWTRVKNSLQQQLREFDERNCRAQEIHDEELRQAKAQIQLLEQELQRTKKNHEDELAQMKASFEADRQKIDESTSARLRSFQEKFEREKNEAVDSLRQEAERFQSDRAALISETESLKSQLGSADVELKQLRQSKTEAEFFSHKCRELEAETEKLRGNVSMLQEEVGTARQNLVYVQQHLDDERRANEAHATLTLAMINAHCSGGGERVEALQAENDKLKHHLDSVTQLLNTLENGIESSEKQKSVYVSSLAETQEQIRRLVGHSNNKQRIQYVGKLQQENRELKEEQVKLRAKVDASTKRLAQLEQQLRRAREHENRLDHTAATAAMHAASHVSNTSAFPKMC
ncbi:hypothetical protein BIW11_11640 [Tropilaelaps mercedesae]|uniref:Hyaluronan-mediated motility receptor C-terminal domain-containing protein n=1 Tax=Tropilaelaps mercedesae TaxID=418985 RepID=A0A1V9XAP5_9ACAR|nr:hypothetical protein BIW11_11640 [Tropilaelaps mercedesae]